MIQINTLHVHWPFKAACRAVYNRDRAHCTQIHTRQIPFRCCSCKEIYYILLRYLYILIVPENVSALSPERMEMRFIEMQKGSGE